MYIIQLPSGRRLCHFQSRRNCWLHKSNLKSKFCSGWTVYGSLLYCNQDNRALKDWSGLNYIMTIWIFELALVVAIAWFELSFFFKTLSCELNQQNKTKLNKRNSNVVCCFKSCKCQFWFWETRTSRILMATLAFVFQWGWDYQEIFTKLKKKKAKKIAEMKPQTRLRSMNFEPYGFVCHILEENS